MSLTTTAGIPIEVHLGPEEWSAALRADAAAGLAAEQKELPPTWLYDERGCELFEAITELPEYYPTRTERSILIDRADEIAERSGADTLVELGAGSAEKTRVLLDAMVRTGSLRRYIPFDVAEPMLHATADAIAEDYPAIDVLGVVGDFREHIGCIPSDGRRMIAFLGGTVGNLRPEERAQFLEDLASTMEPGDSLLLGTDLVKDRDRLIAAYDDAAGVTAEFNKNVLSVLNRQLDADFDVDAFDHVARYDEDAGWIEMHLQAPAGARVSVRGLDLTIELEPGETIRTEISAKFRHDQVVDELAAVGLVMQEWWTDPSGDFALSLSAP
jgi:L-histidine N-alpha-methyltransferase